MQPHPRHRSANAECPACATSHRITERYIAFCTACGHRWLIRTAEEHRARAEQIYDMDYSGYVPDQRFVEFARRFIADELRPRIPTGGRILDVGCGAGDFIEVARGEGYQVEGIDVSSASAAICTRKGLRARAGDFLTETFEGKFDLITMWDVVEHLHEPSRFLNRAHELLSDAGLVFAKVPAFGELSVSLSNKVPRLSGILLGAPDHVQYFDRESLGGLFQRSGFAVDWLPGGDIRSPTRGGSIKRRLGRAFQGALKRASGDRNLFVLAHRV